MICWMGQIVEYLNFTREESILVHILQSIIIYLHVQQPCEFIGMEESVSIRKELNSHRIGLVHQHGRRFIVLEHQYGCRDVMWKRSIRTWWFETLHTEIPKHIRTYSEKNRFLCKKITAILIVIILDSNCVRIFCSLINNLEDKIWKCIDALLGPWMFYHLSHTVDNTQFCPCLQKFLKDKSRTSSSFA